MNIYWMIEHKGTDPKAKDIGEHLPMLSSSDFV